MGKIIGIGIVVVVAVAGLALTVRAEFLDQMTRYPLLLGLALVVASLIGIIRDRGDRPTIEG